MNWLRKEGILVWKRKTQLDFRKCMLRCSPSFDVSGGDQRQTETERKLGWAGGRGELRTVVMLSGMGGEWGREGDAGGWEAEEGDDTWLMSWRALTNTRSSLEAHGRSRTSRLGAERIHTLWREGCCFSFEEEFLNSCWNNYWCKTGI